MTKKSKILIISVASLLVAFLLAGIAYLVFFKEKTPNNIPETVSKISVDTDELSISADDINAKPGETIIVPIKLNHNPGIMASALEIEYNGDKLTYDGFEKGDVFKTHRIIEKEDRLIFTNLEDKNSKKSGTIVKLKFKVRKKAVAGQTEIKVNVTDESFVNFKEKFIKIPSGNAIVTIAEK